MEAHSCSKLCSVFTFGYHKTCAMTLPVACNLFLACTTTLRMLASLVSELEVCVPRANEMI
jgi:hypothetical protein